MHVTLPPLLLGVLLSALLGAACRVPPELDAALPPGAPRLLVAHSYAACRASARCQRRFGAVDAPLFAFLHARLCDEMHDFHVDRISQRREDCRL